ncbi:GNAT family N-acetyltransferase [Nevskia soli]|uniref:GNAT family N-acetyltransferase n=1 Tax=Nevskia soli TaxID=418856 RepID=UPI0015D70F65|nr:GNAT family N-acetyltransferase [Nevskia soli]
MSIVVRALNSQDEFHDAVELQKEIWQFKDMDLLPRRLFVVATKVGGQAFGAYDGGRMVGFALAIPGMKQGYGAYLHSHMVGVAASHRNQGVGRMLKLAQRDDALARGIDLMEWTFDPLEIKNAFFNIERLGAVVRRYVLNQYGISTSVLHTGLPTDRCVAEWWMRSERVVKALAGERSERSEIESRIQVPSDIEEIRVKEPARAREIQGVISEQFGNAFDRGLTVIGFERSEATGDYLLGQFESGRGE